jgi:AAA domain, putative AbiEii toxin, Type IV TA system
MSLCAGKGYKPSVLLKNGQYALENALAVWGGSPDPAWIDAFEPARAEEPAVVRDAKVELRPLNVLIGPNASGKSNLIDVIGRLKSIGPSPFY